TGGDRKSWREYFPTAGNKTSKKRETEMPTEDKYESLCGRFFTTIFMLVCAIFLFAATARANTYVVTTAADNGNNASPTAGSLRKAINDANTNPGANIIDFNIPGSG